MNINLVRLKLLFGDDAIVSKRPDAGEVPSSLVQRGPRTLFFGTRAAKRGPGALDAGLRLGAGSRIEQRRRFRAHARNHLAAFSRGRRGPARFEARGRIRERTR